MGIKYLIIFIFRTSNNDTNCKCVVYRYIALELCAGTLQQVIRNEYNGPSLPSDYKVLYEIASGLHYIHSQNLVHRNIKPENILVSLTAPVHIKLSEFSLMEQFSFHDTFHNGFECKEYLTWIAPEVVKKRKINSSKDQIAEFAFHSTL